MITIPDSYVTAKEPDGFSMYAGGRDAAYRLACECVALGQRMAGEGKEVTSVVTQESWNPARNQDEITVKARFRYNLKKPPNPSASSSSTG